MNFAAAQTRVQRSNDSGGRLCPVVSSSDMKYLAFLVLLSLAACELASGSARSSPYPVPTVADTGGAGGSGGGGGM